MVLETIESIKIRWNISFPELLSSPTGWKITHSPSKKIEQQVQFQSWSPWWENLRLGVSAALITALLLCQQGREGSPSPRAPLIHHSQAGPALCLHKALQSSQSKTPALVRSQLQNLHLSQWNFLCRRTANCSGILSSAFEMMTQPAHSKH